MYDSKCVKGFKPTDLRSDAKPVSLYFVLKYQLDHYGIHFTQFQSVRSCERMPYFVTNDFHCYPYKSTISFFRKKKDIFPMSNVWTDVTA